MIQVRVKQNISKLAPDWNQPLNLKTDQLICINGHIIRKGDPRPYGGAEPKWTFWSDYDIDSALILELEDISEILVSEGDDRRTLVESAPVKITVVK